MCGIAGMAGGVADTAALARMLAAMRHRGPDDSGMELAGAPDGPRVALGSTRLAIIDLSPAGHMPMGEPESANLVVFNGEVYNFAVLRQELERGGERFRSGTDTEVILKAYRRWGAACVERFRGMFAFAVWDAARGELFLARDRMGKKPLYWHRMASGTFVFASEVRAILASGLVSRQLGADALDSFLFNGFAVSPHTLLADVRSLLPAHWARVAASGELLETGRYWTPRQADGSRAPKLGEQIEETRQHLDDAVRLRMVSDVPLGAFLSGGLDSSAVVALMARAGGDVRTFSIAFEEAGFDESLFSRRVACRFGTRHTEFRVGPGEFSAWLEGALGAMDQPSFDGINTYFVCRAARESGLTVALSGLGADEVFGGYPFFRTVPAMSRLERLLGSVGHQVPRALARFAPKARHNVSGPWKLLELLRHGSREGSGGALLPAYQTAQMLFPRRWRQRLLGPLSHQNWFGLPEDWLRFLDQEGHGAEGPAGISTLALRLFLGERCLRDTDAMSMGVSLEVRAPFTDHAFLESALAIPARLRCQGAPDKPLEWRIVEHWLGSGYVRRRKQGFIFPFARWLRQPSTHALVLDTLADSAAVHRAGLNPAAVAAIAQDYRADASLVPWSRIWSLFTLIWWCSRHRISL